MKDFIKWLGVNEKIAKVVVWIFIIMIMLITTNAMLDSLGFPYYKITYDNIKNIKPNRIIEPILNWIMVLINFYVIIFLIFRIKEYKKIFPYSVLYLVINVLITAFSNNAITQIFIISFIIIFCYLFSNKNKKYILYAIIAIIINVLLQGLTYVYKIQSIDFSKLNFITKNLLSIDYFIIMIIIILVKEIYLKKRSERICGGEDKVYSGLENLNKKTNSPKNLQRKSQVQSNKKKKK